MFATADVELVELLLPAMLWSRAVAQHARTALPISTFAEHAGLAALIEDHDRTHPHAPAEGCDRVLSVMESVIERANDVRRSRLEHDDWRFNRRSDPEPVNPYTSPAAALAAGADGAPDPMLLAQAPRVLTYLHLFAVPVDLTSPPTPAQLIGQLLAGAPGVEDTAAIDFPIGGGGYVDDGETPGC